MKKSILLATMSLLFFVGLTSMVSTNPPLNSTCKAQCEVFVAEGMFSSNGTCMGACNTCLSPSSNTTTWNLCMCKLMKNEPGGLESFGFSNLGQCVSFLKSL